MSEDVAIEHRLTKIEGTLVAIAADVVEIKAATKATNGHVAEISREQEQQKGGLAVLKWMVTVTIAMVAAGAAVAGVILAFVAN